MPQVIPHLIGRLLLRGGQLVMTAGGILLLLQCCVWLKSGIWYPLDVQTFWLVMDLPPHVDWIGLQSMIDFATGLLFRLPMSFALIVLGFTMFLLGEKMMPRSR